MANSIKENQIHFDHRVDTGGSLNSNDIYPIDGKLYRKHFLVPGAEFELSCAYCGGAMPLLTKSCTYCNTGRAVYLEPLAKSTSAEPASLPPTPQELQSCGLIIPKIDTPPVEIGGANVAEQVMGRDVNIGRDSKIGFVLATEKLHLGSGTEVNTVITRNLTSDHESLLNPLKINTLILLPNASVVIPTNTKIETVLIGPNPGELHLGAYTKITSLQFCDICEFITKYGCETPKERKVSPFYWASQVNAAIAQHLAPQD